MKSFAAGMVIAAVVSMPVEAEVFRWVSMPDAQFYADAQSQDSFPFPAPTTGSVITDPRGTADIYADITQWIVDRNTDGDPDNDIHYVQQLGDLTQNGNDSREWVVSKNAMDLLAAAGIVFGVAEGNHDCYFDFDNCRDDPDGTVFGETDENGVPLSGSYHTNYLTFFGPDSVHAGTRFSDQPWYRASPSGASNAQLITFEGRKLGFINLSIGNPQAELDWATALIESEPDRIFVVGAHMLNYDAAFFTGRETEPVTAPTLGLTTPTPFFPRTFEPFPLYIDGDPVDLSNPANLGLEIFTYTATGEMGNFGQNVYEELSSQYPNVLMVHSGHNCGENLRTDGTNGSGNPVIEILTDYQCALNGGDGWTRVYEFDFDAGTLTYYTVSPRSGFASDPVVGSRPADDFGFTDRRTPLDAFVDYLQFLYAFVMPGAVDNFPEALEALGVANGAFTQGEIDFLEANDPATYQATLEEVFRQAIGRIVTVPASPAYEFIKQHPDFDEPAEQAYYQAKWNVRFGGDGTQNHLPAGWEDIAFFEGAWIAFFSEDELGSALNAAAVGTDVFANLNTVLACNDTETGGAANKFNRCPSGSVDVNFASYRLPAANVPMVPAVLAAGLAAVVGTIAHRRRARSS